MTIKTLKTSFGIHFISTQGGAGTSSYVSLSSPIGFLVPDSAECSFLRGVPDCPGI